MDLIKVWIYAYIVHCSRVSVGERDGSVTAFSFTNLYLLLEPSTSFPFSMSSNAYPSFNFRNCIHLLRWQIQAEKYLIYTYIHDSIDLNAKKVIPKTTLCRKYVKPLPKKYKCPTNSSRPYSHLLSIWHTTPRQPH
jgi:hypothetical protein